MSLDKGLEQGIWLLAREYSGLAEAGGVKDVVAGLAAGLARLSIPVTVVLPRYGFINCEHLKAEKISTRLSLSLPTANTYSRCAPEEIEVYSLRREGERIFLLDSARTRSKRSVYTYTAEDEKEDPHKLPGSGHWDAHHLNLILQRGALELARCFKEKPAVFHCHDGHSAMLPAIMREGRGCKDFFKDSRAVITIHNAGIGYHQEIYDLKFARQLTGLPLRVLAGGLLGGAVDPLLLGAGYSIVNTVSEGYAEEIISGKLDYLTGGLGKAYREKGVMLLGITNGIDPQGFDPRFPELSGLPHAFDPLKGRFEGKTRCREDLLERLFVRKDAALVEGLKIFGSLSPGAGEPLYTFIGRLTSQKGVDVLAGAISQLLSRRVPVRFLIQGQGEKNIEEALISLTGEVPARGKMAVLIGYNSGVAKLIYGAGDFFLVPSRFEPCGLTDFFAQMMGNLPIVHRVGGLIKVIDGFNGYTYLEHSVPALCRAVLRALSDYRNSTGRLDTMRSQAFRNIFEHYTWDKVLADRYLPLYRGETLPGRPAVLP